ncbi:TPA: Crp/Fnr family transcriptional regulator, partial [Elizabethkingia anophelis]
PEPNNPYIEIIQFFEHFFTVNSEDIRDIRENFKYRECAPNIFLEKKGDITNNLYFVISGFLQVYTETENSEEVITSQINCPTRLITTFESFNSGEPSKEYLKTITKASFLTITKEKFFELLYKDERWTNAFKEIYEQGHTYNEQRYNDLLTLNAEERYLKLMQTRPELINNIPVKILASFIGIKPQSLSRVRRAITLNK